ncbi:hypothetical protein KCP70_16025 [Salmonella enterica subsp. enterica]|nr:hypothetical protein KCP70_16025 [Salmonella enterica subsp. enterica]
MRDASSALFRVGKYSRKPASKPPKGKKFMVWGSINRLLNLDPQSDACALLAQRTPCPYRLCSPVWPRIYGTTRQSDA